LESSSAASGCVLRRLGQGPCGVPAHRRT
jgi:hypothetical protein